MDARRHDGRSLRLLTMIDEFTRHCLAIRVARRFNSYHVIETLDDCMLHHGVPEHVRSDYGAEITAERVRTWLQTLGPSDYSSSRAALGRRLTLHTARPRNIAAQTCRGAVSMPAHQAMNRPHLHRPRMDFQRLRDFIEGKHPQVAESIKARFEPVVHLDSSDVSGGEGLVYTGTHPTLSENDGNPTVGVLIEQPVDFRDHVRAGHAEFPRAQRSGENQSVVRSPSESQMKGDLLAVAKVRHATERLVRDTTSVHA